MMDAILQKVLVKSFKKKARKKKGTQIDRRY
jgi:hypothetical protein